MKEIVLSVCAAAVATGLFSLLVPKSSFKKQLSFLSAAFLLLTAVNSIKNGNLNLDELYKSFEEKSVYIDFSAQAEQMTKQEIAAAQYPNIRFFQVVPRKSDTPQDDLYGEWKPCSPETMIDFSAIAYFFARDLHKEQIGRASCRERVC